MPRNADHKTQVRTIMERDGVNYTTALRILTSKDSEAMRNPFGFATSSESEHRQHLAAWLSEVRRDIYSIIGSSRVPELQSSERRASAHYAAVLAAFRLHPSARLATEEPAPTWERRKQVDRHIKRYGTLLHVVNYRLAVGGDFSVGIRTQASARTRTWVDTDAWSDDGDWIPTDALVSVAEIVRRAARLEMAGDPAASEAAQALRSRKDLSDHDDYYWDYAQARWAQDRGLERTIWACLCGLSSDSGRVGQNHRRESHDCHVMPAFDHARVFRATGADGRKRPAVFVAHPYGEAPAERARAAAIAEQYELKCRLGDEADRGYNPGTTPIVLWNPRVIDLD